MAITEGTQPAPVTWTGAWTAAQTTASFTPDSGALIVALVAGDGAGGGTTAQVSDSVSGTTGWTLLRRQNAPATGLNGTCEVWCRDSPGVAMTVSVTGTAYTANGGQMVVRTLVGAAARASQNGAVNGATLKAAAVQCSVAAGTGSRVYGAAFNFSTSTAMTPLANTTAIAFSDATNGDCWEELASAADTAGTATYGFSTSTDGMIAAAEIKAASGPAPVSAHPGVAVATSAAAGPASRDGTGALFAGAASGAGWANTTGAVGSTQGTYATWTDSGSGTSATLELSSFGAQAAVPSGATVGDVAVTVRHSEDPATQVAGVTAQCWLGTSPYGSAQPLTVSATVHEDTVTVAGLSRADLADLRVRVTATRN